MRIRAARIEDVGALTEIAHEAKRSWGYSWEWITAWANALTIDARVLSTITAFVAEQDDDILGFYGLEGGGRTVALEHLWVRPRAMGRGVGRALLEHAVATAAGGGAEIVVIESDPHAESFYRRFGAERVGAILAPMPGAPDRTLPVLQITIARNSPPVGRRQAG
jgi:predicted N-acetyltransferase YhbS